MVASLVRLISFVMAVMALGSCSLGPSLAYADGDQDRVWQLRCLDPTDGTVRWVEVTQHPDDTLTCPGIGQGHVVWEHWGVGSFDQDHVFWIFEGGEVVFEFYGHFKTLPYIDTVSSSVTAISRETGRFYYVSGKIVR